MESMMLSRRSVHRSGVSVWVVALAVLVSSLLGGLVRADGPFTWLFDLHYAKGPQFDRVELTFTGTGGSISRVELVKDLPAMYGNIAGNGTNTITVDWACTWMTVGDWIRIEFNTDFPEVQFNSGKIYKNNGLIGDIDFDGDIFQPGIGGEQIGRIQRSLMPKPAAIQGKVKAKLEAWGEVLKKWDYGTPGNFPNIETHAKEMAKLYAADGTLLPTVSPKLHRQAQPPTIEDYFLKKFLLQKPVLAKIGDARVGENLHAGFSMNLGYYQGVYTFHLYADENGMAWPNNAALPVDGDGKKYKPVRARFTFVYRRGVNADWSDAVIVQHHSSAEPAVKPNPQQQAAKQGDIRSRLDHWGDVLRKWDYGMAGNFPNIGAHAQAMADLYASDASLLPTVSAGLWRINDPVRPKIKNYFEKVFLPQKPVLAHIAMNRHTGFLGDLGYDQGLYIFHLYADKNGNDWEFCCWLPSNFGIDDEGRVYKIVKARFTFVHRKTHADDWSDALIVQHHSSLEPGANPIDPQCLGDLNGDGFIDADDLGILLGNFGNYCP